MRAIPDIIPVDSSKFNPSGKNNLFIFPATLNSKKFFEENDDCPTCEQHIDEEFKCRTIDNKIAESRELDEGLLKLTDEMSKVDVKLKEYKTI